MDLVLTNALNDDIDTIFSRIPPSGPVHDAFARVFDSLASDDDDLVETALAAVGGWVEANR